MKRIWLPLPVAVFAVLVACVMVFPPSGGRETDWEASSRIQEGMTETEVREVMGRRPSSRTARGGSDVVQECLWESDGCTIYVLFDTDGRVHTVGGQTYPKLRTRLLNLIGL